MPSPTNWVNYTEEVLHPSLTRTTDGNSSTLTNYGSYDTLRVHLNVSAVSGTTPSMTLVVEDSLDGTNWAAVGTFPAVTATGTSALDVVNPFADRIRLRWTLTGTTPSFTFTVRAAAQSPLS